MKTENLAIILTDIVGYTEATSRLSRKEQSEMLNLHNQLLYPIIRNFGGKVVKTIGDALLLIFRSPTDAMLCSMAMQDALYDFNRKSTHGEELHIRIAASLGEVRVDRNDIFGEPVNLTSRIESITPEDEIYLSDAIYLAMNKAEVPCIEVGLKQLKGITEPVRVWQIPRFSRSRLVPEVVANEDIDELSYPFGGAHLTIQNRNSSGFDRLTSRKSLTIGLLSVALLIATAYLLTLPPGSLTKVLQLVKTETVDEAKTAQSGVTPALVKRIASESKPAAVTELKAVKKVQPKSATVAVKTKRIDPKPNPHAELLVQLESGDATQMRAAARQIASEKIAAAEVLSQLQTGLQQHYLRADLDRSTIDALAWYCKVLGATENPDYLPILELVSESAGNAKLKRYALKSLVQLRKTIPK